MSAEMSLIQLKAQLATLELQSDESYVATFKTVADKTKEAYLLAKTQIDSMRNGWIAKDKGIVAEVNISESGVSNNNSMNNSVDISAVLSAVTSGADVTSMLSSFLGQGQVAVRVLYYPLVADVSLSKYDVLDVSLNQDVIIKPASGNELKGKVSYISAVATSSNGLDIGAIMGSSSASSTIPAQVTIENADRSVIVGVDVQVSIITQTIENAVVVPVEVICIDGEEVFVYVLEDGKAVKRDVKLGISSDTHYQILSGITNDDILIKNTFGLEEGVSVES
jgi:multidrug efflux pump subunit AcrA (membrane-fusion protein)